MSFLNPYAFLPIRDPTETTAYDGIARGDDPFIRHDRWSDGGRSGRIVCQLTTATPTVVGGEQGEPTKDQPRDVSPYRRLDPLSDHDSPRVAIPGNSLRGLVASNAETISGSALRVLNRAQGTYSVRKPADSNGQFSAIGKLVKQANAWSIEPLGLVSLAAQERDNQLQLRDGALWASVFADEQGPRTYADCLVAYIGDLRKGGSAGTPSERQLSRDLLGGKYKTFQARNRPAWFVLPTYSELRRYLIGEPLPLTQAKAFLNCVVPSTKNFVVAIAAQKTPRPVTLCAQEEAGSVTLAHGEMSTTGVLYVMASTVRLEDMPKDKKHELFIPYDKNRPLPTLPIESDAIRNFAAIALERSEASRDEGDSEKRLPYLPIGYGTVDARLRQTNGRPQDPEAVLCDGDLVYFNVQQKAGGLSVDEFGYSSIWRRRVPGDIHASFVTAAGQGDVLPWWHERHGLTPAESLFGVVENQQDDQTFRNDGAASRPGRNLASRVRFHDGFAVADEDLLHAPVTLKILSAPKPPSPAMYFRRRNGEIIKKDGQLSLANQGGDPIRPNGRKRFVVQPDVLRDAAHDETGARWETRETQRPGLKLKVQPIKRGRSFLFHVDYENLSPGELELLLCALQPAAFSGREEIYYHRLGLGKPLGLGHVNLRVLAVGEVIRTERYTPAGLTAPRYHRVWRQAPTRTSHDETVAAFRHRYPLESATGGQNSQGTEDLFSTLCGELKGEELKGGGLMDPRALDELHYLGSESAIPRDSEGEPIPVCYPFSLGQEPSGETDGFEWFKKPRSSVPPIENTTVPLRSMKKG